MKRAIAVLAAAIAVYIWGFVYWGATTIPYQVLETTSDDAAAQQAIRAHFPRNGVYALPSVLHDAESLESLSMAGPTAFVFVTAADGRPSMVPSIMIFGFLQGLAVAALVAVLLSWAGAGFSFGCKLNLALLAGVISVVQTQFGDAVWWTFPWSWKLVTSFYEIVCFLILGVILAKMLPANR